MSGPSGESCERCYFWNTSYFPEEAGEIGLCCRYPHLDVIQLNENERESRTGILYRKEFTSLEQWCGEFKPKHEGETDT